MNINCNLISYYNYNYIYNCNLILFYLFQNNCIKFIQVIQVMLLKQINK